jgi:outer membrane protein assembly factor BamB
MSESRIPREANDKQIEQSTVPLEEDARLIADLQRIYHVYAASNARSLERVQERLERRGARLARSKSVPTQPGDFSYSEKQAMKASRSPFAQGSAWRNGISALAAVLVLAVLVGSMAAVFALAGPGKGAGAPGRPNSTPSAAPTTQGSPSPTEAPPPPTTPGVYIDINASDMGAGDYQIAKIDPQTRSILWKQDVGPLTSYPIVVYGNTVYVAAADPTEATFDNYVYALDATTGAVRWKVTVSNVVQTDAIGNPHNLGVLGAPTIDNGTLYISDRAGTLFALNAATGARLWSYTALKSGIISVPGVYNEIDLDPNMAAAANGVVYGAIYDELYAIAAETGKLLWMKTVDNTQLFTSPVLANGVLYLTSSGPHTSNTYAYASKDGTLLWKDALGKSNSSLTVEQGTIYLGADMLYALKASDGSQLWHFNIGESGADSPILANGIVYVDGGNNGPIVFAVNASSGKEVWQKPVANLAGLWAVQDGVIYLGVWPGQVYTMSATDGSVLWHQRFGPALIDKTGRESESAPNITVIG